MYLIDTNVISELRKKENANQGVIDFMRLVDKKKLRLYLSVITIGELRRGIELIRHRGDSHQAALLEKWLTFVLTAYKNNILPVEHEVSQLWGRLRVPNYENAIDKLIAATALIHDLTVVTRNVNDFSNTGVKLLNPFN